MILQELANYYERKRAQEEGALPPQGFEMKEIPFLILLSKEGKFLGLDDTREGEGANRRGRRFLVPQAVKRTSGIRANLLWDNVPYVLGIDPDADDSSLSEQQKERKRTRAAQKQTAFIERIREIQAGEGSDAGLQAVLRFLEGANFQSLLSHRSWEDVLAANANLSFRLEGESLLVCQRPTVKAAVTMALSHTEAAQGQCLVTGETGPVATLHPPIKGVKGAQSTGGNIVSFNLDAFSSHGRSQGENAPIAEGAAFAYTTALNSLLTFGNRQHLTVGDSTVVFWAERENPFEDLAAELLGLPADSEDDPDAGVERVRAAYESPWRGSPPLKEDQTRFFVLGLAPNASRISIRFWHPTTVADLSTRILQHFEDIEVVRPSKFRRYPSTTDLLKSAAVLGKADNIPPNLAGKTLESIIRGTRYPQTLLSHAVMRARAERNLTPDRAALIKGFLVREHRLSRSSGTEVGMALDEANTNIGYRLGRLFAVLEKTQEEALPGINTTILDSFYGSASSAPAVAFPQLLRKKNHHISKIESRGRAVNLERLIGEIMAEITEFPARLDLHDQGRFGVGYYHQRQAFFTKKPERTKEEEQ